jgi:aspartyl-tRNA(Asn)/glutamyl-tRNA(Gln) amidotransferase subunit B
VINKEAVKKTIKTGLTLNCQIPEYSKFDRKNYFYPDLPKGYQISQYDMPLCKGGYLEIDGKKIKVRRVHLEEDTGRLIHEKDYSLVDFNRAGIPLMELVTEPDITSAKEAQKFAEELQLILRYLDVSDADMEKGEMRVEANVSLSNESRMGSNKSRIMLKNESYKLMSLLFEVHNKLGPIYKEKNYQDAIEVILKREGISYEREKNVKLKFENLEVSDFFVDFVIDNKIVLEVKTKPFISNDDIRQASRYIKSLNLPLAIIVNFKHQRLGFKRVVNPTFENNSSLFEENSREIVLGTKVEIKNLNSFKAVENALEYEIKRQTKILESGKKVIQETRGWDDIKGVTRGQREKEEAYDYRYFPEPDLPPLQITPEMIAEMKAEIPELPQEKRKRFKEEYQLDEKSIEFFVLNKDLGEYFEKAMSELRQWVKEIEMKQRVVEDEFFKLSRLCSNYLITDLQALLKRASVTGEDFLITPENFAEFISLIYDGKISSKLAKIVLAEMFSTGSDPSQIIEEKGLIQISDKTEIEKIIKNVIAKNERAVLDYKKGKENALQFLIGQVMSQTKGKAHPGIVNKILKRLLSKNP